MGQIYFLKSLINFKKGLIIESLCKIIYQGTSMNTDQLNSDYGITGQLELLEGKGGFPFIAIQNESAKALICVYSGQVLSFQPANEHDDLMFLSEAAYFQTGKAIKGGVPICWPWFGADPESLGRPAHGFVRNRLWSVSGIEMTTRGETKIVLGLVDTRETREIWPQSFDLALVITVGNTLTLELITRNTGDHAFVITQALHTYFKVGDISQTKVLGLENAAYLDKVDGGTRKTQKGAVIITEEVDRIYTDVPSELIIDDAVLGRRIHISSTGSKTAVVWNPWGENCKKMADLKDDDYKRFVCVETANAAADVVKVSPGGESRLLANYRVERR